MGHNPSGGTLIRLAAQTFRSSAAAAWLSRAKLAALALLLALQTAAHTLWAIDQPELTAKIDAHLSRAWSDASLPAPLPASDATFLRRVMLDLVGRIPTANETRTFLEDRDPHKRAQLVVRLLETPAHLREQARFWRKSWMPQTETPQFAPLARSAEAWLLDAIARRQPLNTIAQQLLAPQRISPQTESSTNSVTFEDAPLSFLAISQYQPELIAANASRAFLGVNLDCAQCHDHPFSRWSQEEFWQTAAFFVRTDAGTEAAPGELKIKIPNSDRVVEAKLFTSETLAWPEQPKRDSGREMFAAWATSPSNRLFARAIVNRLWAKYFGRGIVEPLDDLSDENKPTHPELLDELERALVASHFDARLLIASIVNSRAYQGADDSAARASEAADFPYFTSPAARLLNAEQLDISLHVAAGIPWERAEESVSYDRSERESFLDRFQDDSTRAATRSIPQSLTLMNGSLIARVTDPQSSPAVLAIADAPFLGPSEQLESLFLMTLNRFPTLSEQQILSKYLDPTTNSDARRRTISHLLWALLNSSEFQIVP